MRVFDRGVVRNPLGTSKLEIFVSKLRLSVGFARKIEFAVN